MSDEVQQQEPGVQEPLEQRSDPQQEQQDGKGNSEAARRRHQLREVESERDKLRDQLTAQRRQLIEWRAANLPSGPVDPALLAAAGLDYDDLTSVTFTGDDDTEQGIVDDDGHINIERFDAFAEGVARKFNVLRANPGPQPNPQQGTPPGKLGTTWQTVIQKSGDQHKYTR